VDSVEAERFIIQTNALLLDRLTSEHVNKLNTVLVSIDGNESQTDRNRGKGVYRKVIQNLGVLRENGFEGELIARMTVTPGTHIDEQVISLITDKEFAFKSVHWQLDALFWQNDFDENAFESWVEGVYNPGILRILDTWVDWIRMHSEVLRLYPIVAIMRSLLLKEKTKLRCGAGWNTFNIQTDGKIVPCPVMAGMRDFYVGDIWNTNPTNLRDSVFVGHPCTMCKIRDLCGGRCLYANVTKLWGEKGFNLVCRTVTSMIEIVREFVPQIRELISNGYITIQDIDYGRYNSCEIIP
jgi:putative peptide-modifying radical SAM enzyme